MSEWRTVRLGDVCDKITDGTHHSPANHPTGDYKYITAKNIKPWGLDLSDITYIDAATHREIYSRCDVRKNDVLYIKDGATTGRVALNTLDEQFSLLSSVGVLRPGSSVRPKFLVYALQAPHVRDPMLDRMAGVAITRLTLKKLKDAVIPLAPIDQQDAIVAEIEKQFSRLDEAVAGLKRVKANLKRYKASILKAAVEGRLVPTEADLARRKGHSYETGTQLLQRILDTRRKQWQGRGKYKEPAAPDANGLPELPEGWSWATLEQLAYLVTSGSRGWGDFYSEAGPLFIRAQDIKSDVLTVETVARVDVAATAEGTRSSVGAGDILITITGANVTKSALVPRLSEQAFVSQHVALVKLALDETAPFIFDWVVSPGNGRKTLEAWAYGAGKPGLSLEQVRSLPVALPPLPEQHRIVAEVDRLLSIAREAETEVETNLKRAQGLRQGILSAAFSPDIRVPS